MITDTSSDGECPRCGAILPTHRELYGADADGNRGEWREYQDDCDFCGWSEGDTVYICDDCEGIFDELTDSEDGQFCIDCYLGRTSSPVRHAHENAGRNRHEEVEANREHWEELEADDRRLRSE